LLRDGIRSNSVSKNVCCKASESICAPTDPELVQKPWKWAGEERGRMKGSGKREGKEGSRNRGKMKGKGQAPNFRTLPTSSLFLLKLPFQFPSPTSLSVLFLPSQLLPKRRDLNSSVISRNFSEKSYPICCIDTDN